ncbi:MAG: ATP-binding protein [Parabacteroides sp.]|nr:ATP-binding protein [Parabacteroides sp.]
METAALRKLPIGIQSFEKLRSENFLYVDKTAFVYKLAVSGLPYFLSRPRRFGKSLLLSTLEAYFQGKKELFKGLAIEKLEKDWIEYPVLHLDLNAEKYDSKERLEGMLNAQLVNWERLYQIEPDENSSSIRFMNVIRTAYEQTGRRVVILVDEYDKPLLQTFHDLKLQDDFRSILTAFYTVLKSADSYIQFIFITGVTKFAQVGVFSTLNQLNDISLDEQYAALCGLTREEIACTFEPELSILAGREKLSFDEILGKMTKMYDGYYFSEDAPEGMFNPFSVLSALSKRRLANFWFATGTPTFLVDLLKKTGYDLRDLEGIEVTAASLTDYRADYRNPVPMLYQSGYLTIKGFNDRYNLYRLGYPNEEVKYGFLNFLIPLYTPVSGADGPFFIGKFNDELWAGETESFLIRLKSFFADFPYALNEKSERHYQVVFYLVFKLLGQYADVEIQSCRGRADAVVRTPDYIYVFEFKLDGSAQDALRQIDEKGYLIPYTADGRKLIKVGVSFSAEERNLDKWLIEE